AVPGAVPASRDRLSEPIRRIRGFSAGAPDRLRSEPDMQGLWPHIVDAGADAGGAGGGGSGGEGFDDRPLVGTGEVQRPSILPQLQIGRIAVVVAVRTGPVGAGRRLAAGGDPHQIDPSRIGGFAQNVSQLLG